MPEEDETLFVPISVSDPAPAAAPAPAPAPIVALAPTSSAKKFVKPLIILVMVALAGGGAWYFVSARKAKAEAEAASQAAAAAATKAKAVAQAAAKAQEEAAEAAKAAAEDPVAVRRAIQKIYDDEAAFHMASATATYEPAAFAAKFGQKRSMLVDTAKLAGLPTLSTTSFNISALTLLGDEALVVVQKHEGYAVGGIAARGKPIVRDTEFRTIWSNSTGVWKFSKMAPLATGDGSASGGIDREAEAKKTAAAQRAANDAVMEACVSEIGILCNSLRDNFKAVKKCLKEDEGPLRPACRNALSPPDE